MTLLGRSETHTHESLCDTKAIVNISSKNICYVPGTVLMNGRMDKLIDDGYKEEWISG